MNRLHLGLAVAIAVGVAVALFPLYADALAPHLWSYEPGAEEEEDLVEVEGVVQGVDEARSTVTVDGHEILVKGEWTVEYSNGTVYEAEYYEVLSLLASTQGEVKVYCVESGRWGLMAEEIVAPGFHAYKQEG